MSEAEKQTDTAPEPKCTCWFNKRGELIYVEWACPKHGEKNDNRTQGK